MRVFTIGIAGGTGSGKTTITRRVMREFGNQVSVVYHDNYYKRHDDMTYEQRSRLNYDRPEAFDTYRLVQDLEKLRRGEAIDCPVYDYSVHNRSDRTIRIEPSPVVLVEGILLLQSSALRRCLDLKVFVDADADVRILRRITRDVRDRGRTLESVVNQYLTTVKPMHELYVEPSKRTADIIIPEGGKNEAAMQLILARVREVLAGGKNG